MIRIIAKTTSFPSKIVGEQTECVPPAVPDSWETLAVPSVFVNAVGKGIVLTTVYLLDDHSEEQVEEEITKSPAPSIITPLSFDRES